MSNAGEMHYMGAEMFTKEDCTEKVDAQAFALILYEVLIGRPAFEKDLMCQRIRKTADVLRHWVGIETITTWSLFIERMNLFTSRWLEEYRSV
jgi:hypothetical protein